MTAAAGVLTGLAKLKRQDSSRSQHRPIPAPPPGLGNQEGAPRKRKRRADVVVVRGRLRLYSASGFFLLLGLLVLAMGIGMATLGYWPHGPPHNNNNDTVPLLTMPTQNTAAAARGSKMASSGDVTGDKMAATGGVEDTLMYNASASNNGNSSVVGASRGLLARFLEQHRHSERMKMLGPFTMGIGIFIFICANAILHENRDRETKVIHMRDMYSTVIDIHRLRQREYKHHRSGSFYAGESGEPPGLAARQAGSSPLAFSHRAGRSSLGGAGSAEEEEGLLGAEFQRARRDRDLTDLLAPLYPERPGGRWTAADRERGEWGGACSIVSSSLSAFTLPVIKLNNCVIDEPEMEAITEEERAGGWRDGERGGQRQERSSRPPGGPPSSPMLSLAVPVATVAKASKPPGLQRSHSASSSPCSSSSSSSLSPAPSSTSGCWLSPGAARSSQDFGSNSSLHMLSSHSKSLDLERRPSTLSVHRAATEQRKHPSWPRLDRSSSSSLSINHRGSSKGYVLLEDREEGGGERSLAAGGALLLPPPTAAGAAAAAAARRDYSKREKLLMISRSHNNLSFEHDEVNSSTLKRGSSETRF